MRSILGVVVLTMAVACATEGPDETAEVSSQAVTKVTLCHIPPQHPENAVTLEVTQPAATNHLAHGDYLGPCQQCTPGSTVSCYSGPAGSEGVGACHAGTQACNANGHGYGECSGEVTPTPDVCGDGIDSDCDGIVDEGCVCTPGSSTSCYDGPPGTEGVGTCSAGTQACETDGSGYGACSGSVGPEPEVCGDGTDTDCDGFVDETCACTPNATRFCYSGSPDTVDVGVCASGTETCAADGSAWGACDGEVLPSAEQCGDALDNDCDGTIDDGCVCAPNSTAACYGGPAGTAGVGACQAGSQTCNSTGTGYGACTGDVVPAPDLCGDSIDSDCDGFVDEGCCTPEVCGDGVDNDCDGLQDEGCIGDRAWRDADIDGLQDPGEAGLPGATFLLRTASGALVQVAVSDVAGTYWFAGVPAGTYYVEVIPPVGYGATSPDQGTNDTLDSDFDGESLATPMFTFGGGGNATIDGGFVASIGS